MPVAAQFTTRKKVEGLFGHLLADDDSGWVTTVHTVEDSDLLCRGDICNIYRCDFEDRQAVLKLARDSSDNDLVTHEAEVLLTLQDQAGELSEPKDPSIFLKYLPEILHTGDYEGRGYHLLARLDGWHSLEEIHAAYPTGLDYRDAVWMYRRILEGISYAHDAEVFHGAILPPHVMINPTDHGAKLLDWSYAVTEDGACLKALSAPYREWYPPDVFERRPVRPNLDLLLATKVFTYLVGGDPVAGKLPDFLPKSLSDLLTPAMDPDSKKRPEDIPAFYRRLEDTLEEVVGPRRFRPFTMPASG